jgi:hypothetical protein
MSQKRDGWPTPYPGTDAAAHTCALVGRRQPHPSTTVGAALGIWVGGHLSFFGHVRPTPMCMWSGAPPPGGGAAADSDLPKK